MTPDVVWRDMKRRKENRARPDKKDAEPVLRALTRLTAQNSEEITMRYGNSTPLISRDATRLYTKDEDQPFKATEGVEE